MSESDKIFENEVCLRWSNREWTINSGGAEDKECESLNLWQGLAPLCSIVVLFISLQAVDESDTPCLEKGSLWELEKQWIYPLDEFYDSDN